MSRCGVNGSVTDDDVDQQWRGVADYPEHGGDRGFWDLRDRGEQYLWCEFGCGCVMYGADRVCAYGRGGAAGEFDRGGQCVVVAADFAIDGDRSGLCARGEWKYDGDDLCGRAGGVSDAAEFGGGSAGDGSVYVLAGAVACDLYGESGCTGAGRDYDDLGYGGDQRCGGCVTLARRAAADLALAGLVPIGMLVLRRRGLRRLGGVAVLGCAVMIAGCGASRLIPATGISSGGGPVIPTPAGTYNLVVSATSAGLTRSVGVTLIVQ